MDYLIQVDLPQINHLKLDNCNAYIKTMAGYSFKTVKQNICGLRYFLRYLYSEKMISDNYAEKIHMPLISKSAKIPSAWNADELKAMIAAIDRNSPIGKRDYAMILLACILGLRMGDIKLHSVKSEMASLYKRYPPEDARRIMKRLEIHYTPKHGSWLDIAEIELNVMTRQCLSRRIADIGLLRRELSAWEVERNTLAAKVNWHFRTGDARIKLSSLYPRFTTAS